MGQKIRCHKPPSFAITSKSKAKEVKQEFTELKDPQSCESGLILEYEGVRIHLQVNFDQLILRRCLDCLKSTSC